MLKKKIAWCVLFFSLPFFLYFLPAIRSIGEYNVNWDEPVHFIRGQAYLRLLLTGQKSYTTLLSYNDFQNSINDRKKVFPKKIPRYSIYQSSSMDGEYFLQNDSGHPPINGILAALSNYIFYQKIGIIGDVESYHFFIIVMSFILVIFLFQFVTKEYGIMAGVVTVLALSSYPLFIAESHNNIKDPVETAFIYLAVLTFYNGVVRAQSRWIVISAIITGLALGTKLNIIFLPLVLGLWVTALFFRQITKYKLLVLRKVPGRILFTIFLSPFIAMSIVYFFWPFLWNNPVEHLKETFGFYRDIGIQGNYQGAYFWIFKTYALRWIISITPLPVFFLAIFGIVTAVLNIRNEKNKQSFIFLFLLCITIGRVTISQGGIYGGVRQIFEYIPALALFAGIGAQKFWQFISIYKRRKIQIGFKISYIILLLLMFGYIFHTNKQIHPNENLYFNAFAGGLSGAAKSNFPDWNESLGNPYLQGVDWINQHAEPYATLILSPGLKTNIPSTKIRKDILFSNAAESLTKRNGEYIMALSYHSFPLPYDAQYPIQYLQTVYEKKVDGVPILKIWKNDIDHTKPGYVNEKEITNLASVEKQNNRWLIKFNKTVKLTRLELMYSAKYCLKNDNGDVATSLEGKNWKTETEGLLDQQIPAIKKDIYSGDIIHLFAGLPTKYLRISITSANSCIFSDTSFKIYALGD